VVGDLLRAGSGSVTLTGTSGPDILIGGSAADTLVGGGGSDTFYVNAMGDVVQETPGQGTATVYVSASSWTATSGSAITSVIAQGSANIKLIGNGSAMTLISNTGVDTLDDGGGPATLVGNGASDIFIVRNAATVVQALAGSHETVQTTLASYTLPANVANLTSIGTASFYGVGGSVAGTLTGGPGSDTLVSGSAVESLIGGALSNTFYVNNANDVITAPSSANSVEFASVSGVRAGVNVAELAFTGSGNDVGYGNSTAVLLMGNAGNDTLIGGSGNDTLDGGLGADMLTGGTGSNLFRFDGFTGGVDKISNYVSTQDHIGLSASGFGITSLSQLSFEFGTSLNPLAGHANVLYNTATGALYYDAVGGDGHIVQIATLTTHPVLSSSDFVLA
jgi:Ca2+-binding RTX toxin-like protein